MSTVQTQGQNNEEFAMVRILLLNKKNGSEPSSMLRFLAKTMRINGYKRRLWKEWDKLKKGHTIRPGGTLILG